MLSIANNIETISTTLLSVVVMIAIIVNCIEMGILIDPPPSKQVYVSHISKQGTLTEGKGSVRLTSLLDSFFKEMFFQYSKQMI